MGIINGEVIIRSNYKSEILIIINSKDKINIPNINENIKGIIINDKVIYGNDYFYEEINNIKYKRNDMDTYLFAYHEGRNHYG